MRGLKTPFGEIAILLDQKPLPYTAQAGPAIAGLCPDLLGRFQIAVRYKPDGREHSLACVFTPVCSYERTPESGECLECQSFYNAQRIKMSIGLECEAGYPGGAGASDKYDYSADYLENGMAYLIFPDTKTEEYVFGIAWIADVGWEDPVNPENDRDVETWFGADPTLAL